MSRRTRRHTITCASCGDSFEAARSNARYCSPRCKKRAQRSRDNGPAEPVPAATPSSSAGEPSGRLRESLEEWLGEREDLPEMLVEHARVLAGELDSQPDDSPLHGRFSAALAALAASAAASEIDGRIELVHLQRLLETGCGQHPHGAAHCAECCIRSDGLAELESWQPSPRWFFEGRSGGEPLHPHSDEQYARAVIAEFLRRQRAS